MVAIKNIKIEKWKDCLDRELAEPEKIFEIVFLTIDPHKLYVQLIDK